MGKARDGKLGDGAILNRQKSMLWALVEDEEFMMGATQCGWQNRQIRSRGGK